MNTIQQLFKSCLIYKSHTGKNPQYQHSIPSIGASFHIVSININGNLPTAVGGHNCIFTAIDCLT